VPLSISLPIVPFIFFLFFFALGSFQLTFPPLFSVLSSDSFDNIREKWYIEIQHYSPGTPIVLVGTKMDLRNDPDVRKELESQGQEFVTSSQAESLRKEIGAAAYIECSAMTQEEVPMVFEESVRAGM